jgi:hypothetical protein
MKKTILVVILILTTTSCASLMDFDGVYRSDGSAVVDPNPYDPSLDLLYGLRQTAVILALANEKPDVRNDYLLSAYYYPPLLLDHYVPPNIWREWTALQRSLWIRSAQESDLRDYEYKIKRINWDLEDEARRLIDEIKRAKEKD